jgi:hypothetical protein
MERSRREGDSSTDERLIALAGATACTIQPTEHVVPYVKPIEGLIPASRSFTLRFPTEWH